MDQLITTPDNAPTALATTDNFCGRCGNVVVPTDNFCRHCGNTCHDVVVAEIITQQSEVQTYYGAAPAPSPAREAIKRVLDNRWMVMGIVAILGPIGLPALWFSPRFRPPTKMVITTLYVVLTAVVPVVVSYYVLENSFKPLVEAFGS